MTAVTWLILRVCAGLGIVLLLAGGGILFLNWRDSWKVRLGGLLLALTGLVLALAAAFALYQYQQSVDFLRNLRSIQGRANFSGMLLIVGGYGAFSGAKVFRTRKVLRVLCGAAAVLGLIFSIYYAVLIIKLYL